MTFQLFESPEDVTVEALLLSLLLLQFGERDHHSAGDRYGPFPNTNGGRSVPRRVHP